MSDFKAQFKAAKASRAGPAKLSKEQIKALKTQRAAAEARAAEEAAKQRAKQEAARLAAAAAPPIAAPAVSAQPASNSLRTAPPPKFAPAPPPKFSTLSAPLSDSQVTQVHSGSSSAGAGALQSTASKELPPGVGPQRSAVRDHVPTDVPLDFFEGSTGSAPGDASSLAPGFFEAAPENGVGASGPPGAPASASSVRTDESHSSLPAGFFEALAETPEEPAAQAASLPQPSTSRAVQFQEQHGPIPKGFFADKDADAKARGEDVKKKSKEEEFSDFMTSIAADVQEAEERDQEAAADAAAEREEREQFEQRMRQKRLEGLKTGGSQAQKEAAAYTLTDAALNVDVILDEASQQQRKRRKVDVKQDLEPSVDEEEGDASSDEDLELDWRAKTV